MSETLKPLAEQQYQQELNWLQEWDKQQNHPQPPQWQLSPKAVLTFIIGGEVNGHSIERKYHGADREVQVAVATLTTDRALLLYGPPGTGKSLLSELLAAGVSGDSSLIVQGSAGSSEEKILYEWDYAYRLSKGTDLGAIVKTPVYRAMEDGKIARVEELTRIPSDVQDALITILSEKMLPIPELNHVVLAERGFNIIATANDKDKGVNDLSRALSRRFNTVRLELPTDMETEVAIVRGKVEKFTKAADLAIPSNAADEIMRVVRIFRELREGEAGGEKLQKPSATMSPAEAISVVSQAINMAAYFDDGEIEASHIASGLEGVVVKEAEDREIFRNYVDRVLKVRAKDHDLEVALRDIVK
ncbi:MAG: AAA domain-containing protein [Methylococcaceae bacterium]|nr:AAA domain-containing protein [Methylococcaceae bacterium]